MNMVRFRRRSLDGNGRVGAIQSAYSKGEMPLLKRLAENSGAGSVEGAALGLARPALGIG